MRIALFGLLLFIASANAAPETFFPSSLRIRRGSSVGDQEISALSTNEQTGTEDNWSSYLELSNNFRGDFTIQVPDGSWESLNVHWNMKGEAYSSQRWEMFVRNFDEGKWTKIGDNTDAPWWVWFSQSVPVSWNGWLSSSNKIKLRFQAANYVDVCNLDYLAVEITKIVPPTVYHPSSVNVVAGAFTGNQPIEVLSTNEQTGSQDLWDSYLELNENFVGDFIITVPTAVTYESMNVWFNMRGEAHQYQVWNFLVWDYNQNTFTFVGDNTDSPNWIWNYGSFHVSWGGWMSAAGEVKVRVLAAETGDILNLDFLGVEVNAGTPPTPPSPPTPPTPPSPPTPPTPPSPPPTPPTPPSPPTPPTPPSPPPTPPTPPSPPPTPPSPPTFVDRQLVSSVTNVQPMTGIVLWESSHAGSNLKDQYGNIQLEYSYMPIDQVVTSAGTYNWDGVETLLNRIQGRSHQAILRFYYVYPGAETTVPAYIKAISDYQETTGITEGKLTHFPDWSHPELKSATLNFYSALVARYNTDPRLAFLQVGFGLWGEYHIYQPGVVLGQNFPSKSFQEEFLRQLDADCTVLRWSISIDAGSSSVTPIANDPSILALGFGLFDDSFMHEGHADYNRDMFLALEYSTRYTASPIGGELGYYTYYDQQNALNVGGMHGRTYEQLSAQYFVSYMLGNDQPSYQTDARIKQAGMSNGYRFKITAFSSSSSQTRVTVQNTGIAPLYYDAFVAANGVQSSESLKGLLPGQSQSVTIESGGDSPTLTIESPRLVSGQVIQFEANLQP